MTTRLVLEIDAYKKEFDHANSELSVRSLILKHTPTEYANLSAFLDACHKVKQVCLRYGDVQCVADLQLWLRNSIVLQYSRCENCQKQQGKCIAELTKLDRQMSHLFPKLGANVVPLKQPLRLKS
ncbi:hypothetical protein CWC18_18540 [Pseudoalteromonas aurantia]|uniref:hypothetical protein n=1 Tax=Pseudoalteromonas aurantia TaxID=43654 RepID=UPI00110B6B43|nr:hypothetical protein [Pseudoalteromonas aurantia]TMO57433.1 hypothetical protein CWC18_18540 [Pseudoalteromonas aurantia]